VNFYCNSADRSVARQSVDMKWFTQRPCNNL